MAVLLHLGPCNFPPLFPIAADDILQYSLDLIGGGRATEVAQRQLDHRKVMKRRLALQPVKVESLASEDVVLSDGLERLRRKGEVHRVTCLIGEVDVHPP